MWPERARAALLPAEMLLPRPHNTAVHVMPVMWNATSGTATPRTWSAGACQIEVVARLLTHRSSTTTSQVYVHLGAADIREALTRAGVWREEEAR